MPANGVTDFVDRCFVYGVKRSRFEFASVSVAKTTCWHLPIGAQCSCCCRISVSSACISKHVTVLVSFGLFVRLLHAACSRLLTIHVSRSWYHLLVYDQLVKALDNLSKSTLMQYAEVRNCVFDRARLPEELS